MKEYQLKIQKTAHYYTVGELSEDTEQCFVVFHGYGQLASQIIHKFDHLGKHVFAVAPEGFSRFYWNERTQQVGASWMTSQDRLIEIDDYCNYLNQFYTLIKEQFPANVQVNFLGFSQGGATVVRWCQRMRPEFDNLILWGSAFPMDISYAPETKYFNNKNTHYVYGSKDKFLTEKRIAVHKTFMEQQKLEMTEHVFEGGHEIERNVLTDIAAKLRRLR